MLQTPTIRQVATTAPEVYAFRIAGEVTRADMEAMADHMNGAFDRHDKVSMLLIFDRYEGSEFGAGFDWSSLKSRLRSLAKVDRYVVVGAPDAARRMIAAMDAIIPVDARTLAAGEIDAAWAAVGARPA